MTTKVKMDVDKQLAGSSLAPYLGEIWSHFPNLRILLTWKAGDRYLHICKSSEVMNNQIQFKITVILLC
jgi:hypothetical protein